jgi:hypothetical protein
MRYSTLGCAFLFIFAEIIIVFQHEEISTICLLLVRIYPSITRSGYGYFRIAESAYAA